MKAGIVCGALLLAACSGSPPQPTPSASPTADTRTAAMRAYDEASARMHASMGAADRDPDVAFARGMIPHHEGAVAMAKIQLQHGRDPEMRALAQAVVEAQDREIALMREWLAKRGAQTTPAATGPHAH